MKRMRPVCPQGRDGEEWTSERKERRAAEEEEPSPDAERGGGNSMARIPALGQDEERLWLPSLL